MTISEVLENEYVRAELKRAWVDSFPGISGGHEEGGFIVIDESGVLSVIRWEKGSQNEIVLPPHKNCFIEGKIITASFHTHPNTGKDFQQEPSLTDIRAIRDDPDLRGESYIGEFVISGDNLYLIELSGQISVIAKTEDILEI